MASSPARAEPFDGREAVISLRGLSKRYGPGLDVLSDVTLDVRRGEFLTLLGPSGSGKTTTLMLIAGFQSPSAGSIVIEGRDVTAVPPYRRDLGVVFQSYALFPHMTVAQNVAFPLALRKLARTEIGKRVAEALDLVHLSGLGTRRIAQLSGGQQQRVALARALVYRPRIVLMDEPLGALDRSLREAMQREFREIHRNLGITFIYVTHDQGEALAMSDRIAVFRGGRLVQLGTPETLYREPVDTFVAGFLGESNRLPGRIVAWEDGVATIALDGAERLRLASSEHLAPGADVDVIVRPEGIVVGGNGANRLAGTLTDAVFQGDHLRLAVTLGNHLTMTVKSTLDRAGIPDIGEPITLAIPERDRAILFPRRT